MKKNFLYTLLFLIIIIILIVLFCFYKFFYKTDLDNEIYDNNLVEFSSGQKLRNNYIKDIEVLEMEGKTPDSEIEKTDIVRKK